MKRLQLGSFKQQAIPTFAVNKVKGGYVTFNSFCDWYLNQTGGNPDPQTMALMMEHDKVHQGNIVLYA